jgi:hypothetical protein
MIYINVVRGYPEYLIHQGMIMKLILDNLFFLGEVISVAGLAWGAGLVLRDSLAGTVFPSHKKSALRAVLRVSLAYPFRKIARARV